MKKNSNRQAASTLWAKGQELNPRIQAIVVGDDLIIDQKIIWADCVGSAAHAAMLAKVGLLSARDSARIRKQLAVLYKKAKRGILTIPAHLEDMHTTIESSLTEALGQAGKKIHTARSRNDQVLLATRIYSRESLLQIFDQIAVLTEKLLLQAEKTMGLPLPGYTHFQQAMPSSVGMWFHSLAEGFIDLLNFAEGVFATINQNPLGGGAGFGTNLPIDRSITTKLLAFDRCERSPIASNNRRGRVDLLICRVYDEFAFLLGKYASDLILFSSSEFDFVALPDSLTTGSSIMPQKRNPDVVELMRGKASRVRSAAFELEEVTAKLPTSYHRDFQYTKAPLLRAQQEVQDLFVIADVLFDSLRWKTENITAKTQPEIYSTYRANLLVQEGVPFRDAYRLVAEEIKNKTLQVSKLVGEHKKILKQMQREVGAAKKELAQLQKRQEKRATRIRSVYATLWR